MLSDCVAWTTSNSTTWMQIPRHQSFCIWNSWVGGAELSLSSLPSHSDAWEAWRNSPTGILPNPFHFGRHSKTQSQRQHTGVNPRGCLGCSEGQKEFLSKSAELPWHMLLHDRWEWSRQPCWLFHMSATVFLPLVISTESGTGCMSLTQMLGTRSILEFRFCHIYIYVMRHLRMRPK